MKPNTSSVIRLSASLALGLLGATATWTHAAGTPPPSAPIPLAELGAKVGAQYQGDGLAIQPTPDGASLRCVFQKLEGEATPEGLWLTSTAKESANDRFRVVAVAVGRERRSSIVGDEVTSLTSIADFQSEPPHVGSYKVRSGPPLVRVGTVEVEPQRVRFLRPGLVEEYTVSADGVRQDFVVLERSMAGPPSQPDAGGRRGLGRGGHEFSGGPLSPALSPFVPHGEREAMRVGSAPVPGEGAAAGEGGLRVELAVAGAKVEALVNGARLVLDGSGRKLAYNRLRVVDAQGRELPARMEVAAINRLALVVDDATAVYPVRIDPTFSDENWVSLGGFPGD